MGKELLKCPTCKKAPTWGAVGGVLSLCCDCDGIGFEPLQDTPEDVLNQIKATAEGQWNEAVRDAELYFAKGAGRG